MNIKRMCPNDFIRQQKGIILFMTLFYAFLISAFVAVFYYIVTMGIQHINRAGNVMKAYYAADAGLADAFMQLRAFGVNPPQVFNVLNNHFSAGLNLEGSYNVAVNSDGTAWPVYTLVSTGQFNGQSKILTLRVRANSIAQWIYLSNTEIHPTWGRLYWGTGMTTVGEVHTNGQLNIYGTPIFDGPVSQSASSINYYFGGPPADNPDFRHGLTLSAPQIAFTGNAILNSVSSAAQQIQGLLLTGDSTITFMPDGTMNVTNSQKNWNNKNMGLPENKAVFVSGGNATVQGTLAGQVTVATNQSMYISGHIVYKTDPRTHPESTDLLGLVAQNNVTIKQNAPANLEVDAYVVSANGSYQLENFQRTGLKGDMVQFGGLANNVCGPTGVFNSQGQLISGYNQIQIYDTRLKTTVPPWFPPAMDQNGRVQYSKLSLTET